MPPIVARGGMLDVAAAKGVAMLPDGYRITRTDLEASLLHQRVDLRQGDVVLIRTGRMRVFDDTSAPLKLRGADAAPLRPVAIPLR